MVGFVTRIGGGLSLSVERSWTSLGASRNISDFAWSGVMPLYKQKRMSPPNGPVHARRRSRWLWINAFNGYRKSARTPSTRPSVRRAWAMLLMTGTMKHSVLPEPVPLVTTTD